MLVSAVMLLVLSCSNTKANAAQDAADAVEGVDVMEVDSLTLVAINDNEGEKRMPNKLFYGEADSAKVERLSPEGSVPSSVSCFIVKTQGKNILFDTGNGMGRGGRLLDRMKAVGIQPEDIDLLVLTHFHMDHIGGMTDGGRPVFTNAEVYVPDTGHRAYAGSRPYGWPHGVSDRPVAHRRRLDARLRPANTEPRHLSELRHKAAAGRQNEEGICGIYTSQQARHGRNALPRQRREGKLVAHPAACL